MSKFSAPSKKARLLNEALNCALTIVLVATTAFSQASPQTATDTRSRGLELLRQGDVQGAIELLKAAVKIDKTDDEAWHALGLAYESARDQKNSADSFKSAATLRLNKLFIASPLPVSSDQLEVRAKLARRFTEAIDSIERYIAATSNADPSLTADLNPLRFYRDFYADLRTDERIVASKEATTRLRIQHKPPPDFSGTRASGLATLRAVFSADGTVKHIVVVGKVEPAFDQACRDAAKNIRFAPAIKDDRPVSMILQLEYRRSFFLRA